jgi:glutamine synthetase
LNLRKAPEAIDQLKTPLARQLFTGTGILTEAELSSRHHVMVERYVKKLLIEAECLTQLVDQYVVPAALKEQSLLAGAISAMTGVNRSVDVTEQNTRLKTVTDALSELLQGRRKLGEFLHNVERIESEMDKAHALAKECSTLMGAIRTTADRLENIVSDEFWALPKYREMLFLN